MNALILGDRNAQRIFWGQLISQSCDMVMSVGILWVLTVQFSPRWIPWFIGIGAVPHLFLSTYSGKWIKKHGALRTVTAADAFRGLLFLAVGWGILYVRTSFKLLMILLASTFVSNTAGALFNPAILSLPVEMMPPGLKRDKLTALLDSCFSFGSVLGPLVSALVYSAVGLGGLLIVNGISYFFSAFLASGVKLSKRIGEGTPESLDGGGSSASESGSRPKSTLQVLKSEPVIFGMLGRFLLINLFLAPIMVFMPWYVKNVYKIGIAGLAALEVCIGLGTLAGSLLLSFTPFPGFSAWKKIMTSVCVAGLAYLAFSFSKGLVFGSLAVGILGFCLGLVNVMILTFFQNSPQPQDVPVIMGVVNLIGVASLPISMGIAGAVIEYVPVKSLAISCAVIMIAVAVSFGFIPGIRRIA